jgi:hypothetical protein
VIESLWLAATLASTAIGGAAGFALASRRARRAGEARLAEEAGRHQRELDRTRARALDATKQHREENALLRSALGLDGGTHARDLGRSARFDRLLGRLRGLAFVDAAVVADATGLLSRGDEDALAREVASLAAAAMPLARSGGARSAIEIRVAFASSLAVALRPLPGWAGDAFVVVASRGRSPSPLALESTDALARLMTEGLDAPALETPSLEGWSHRIGGARGDSARQLGDELGRFRAAVGALSVGLSFHDELLAADTADGASEAALDAMRARLATFVRFAARRARSVVRRCDVVMANGLFFSWVPLPDSSKFAVLAQTRHRPIDDLELDRLIGKIRRLTVRESQKPETHLPRASA